MSWSAEKLGFAQELTRRLYHDGMIQTWYRHKPEGWTLISGTWSPLYIQLRLICSFPETLRLVGTALGAMIRNEMPDVDRIFGIAMAGVPLAAAISLAESIPGGYTRKLDHVRTVEELERQIAIHGSHRMAEGTMVEGDRIVVVDDVVTEFNSKLIGIKQLTLEAEARGLENVRFDRIAIVLDREQGAQAVADRLGLVVHALIPFRTKGLAWLRDELAPIEYHVLTDYLADPSKYQNPDLQADLMNQALASGNRPQHTLTRSGAGS